MKPRLFCPLMAMLLAVSVRAEAPPPVRSVEVFAPRDYGVVMGQVIPAEIRATVEAGYELQTAVLPLKGSSVDDFLELRDIRWTRESRDGVTLYRIDLSYQVFKGVREAEILAVPALPLRFQRGETVAEVESPVWRFTLNPIIPPRLPDEEVKLRGERLAPDYDLAGPRRRSALLLALPAGLGLHGVARLLSGTWRRKVSRFAQAARELRKLARQGRGLEQCRLGLRRIHAALDATAGHALCAGQLERFLAAQPRFQAAKDELEAFFALSERLFFVVGEVEVPPDETWARLIELCKRMAALERGSPS
jgi:mxaA protein